LHNLPTSENQIKALLSNVPHTEDFFETKTTKIEENGKKKYQIEVKPKKILSEEEWKLLC